MKGLLLAKNKPVMAHFNQLGRSRILFRVLLIVAAYLSLVASHDIFGVAKTVQISIGTPTRYY